MDTHVRGPSTAGSAKPWAPQRHMLAAKRCTPYCVRSSSAPRQDRQWIGDEPIVAEAPPTASGSAPLVPGASRRNELYRVAAASSPATPSTADTGNGSAFGSLPPAATVAAGVAALGLAGVGLQRYMTSGSRPYSATTVGDEYDQWTEGGILEYYWGEHIHLGYYTEAERAAGFHKKDYKQAKYDFCDEMLKFSGASNPVRVLDVGCGFGGTSRHLGKLFPDASVTGITLSPKQVQRGMELCAERGLDNVKLQVMDALKMEFADNTFDLVWACESGEHMPDKKKYIEEMARVLKPGGTLVIACWCQREETEQRKFTDEERQQLQFLYDEWAHPFFISIQEFERLMKGTNMLEGICSDDWTLQTLPDWHNSIISAAKDPWYLLARPQAWYRTFRDVLGLLRMHDGFSSGLMQYGMMRAVKKAA